MRRPRKRCPGSGRLVIDPDFYSVGDRLCQHCKQEVGVRKVYDVDRWKWLARYHQVSA